MNVLDWPARVRDFLARQALADRARAALAPVRDPAAAVLDHARRGLRARSSAPARERAQLLHRALARPAARRGDLDRECGRARQRELRSSWVVDLVSAGAPRRGRQILDADPARRLRGLRHARRRGAVRHDRARDQQRRERAERDLGRASGARLRAPVRRLSRRAGGRAVARRHRALARRDAAEPVARAAAARAADLRRALHSGCAGSRR